MSKILLMCMFCEDHEGLNPYCIVFQDETTKTWKIKNYWEDDKKYCVIQDIKYCPYCGRYLDKKEIKKDNIENNLQSSAFNGINGKQIKKFLEEER